MIRKIISIVLVLAILGFVFKDQVLKAAISVGATHVTGVPVKIQDFSFSVLKQRVSVKGFQLYQPEGYEHGVLLDVPEVTVSYNLPDLIKGRVYLPSVAVNVKEMVIIKDQDGKLNVDALTVAQKEEAAVNKDEPKAKKDLPLQIDILTLTVGRVVVKDYTQGGEPQVQVVETGIKDRVFKNITTPEQLVALVMAAAMTSIGIKGAAIYGVAGALGVAFLPAGVAGILLGDDDSEQEFAVSLEKAYEVGLQVVQGMGEVVSQDLSRGVIKAKVQGAQVTIELSRVKDYQVRIKVSARKYFLPKPETAGGILYQIGQKL